MKTNVKKLIIVSMLIALEVLLSRFMSIATPIVKVGFGFVPIAICAMMYGPIWAAGAGTMADIIGATLFPIGAYFPGFTLSAALTGLVFGLFLYKKEDNWNKGKTVLRITTAVSINCIGISLCLSTFWLTIITESPFFALLPTRILQNVVMIPIQLIILTALHRPVLSMKKQYI